MENILVVEDNTDLLETLKLILEEEGNKVLVASSVREASKYLSYNKSFVALVDVNLPDGEGDELAVKLRANPHLKKVILMSARNDLKELAEEINVDYVTKPFNIGVVLSKLTEEF